MAPRWTPITAAAAYQAAASGTAASVLARQYGCSRGAVIGAVYRYSVANDLPRIRTLRATVRLPPPPSKQRPPNDPARSLTVRRKAIKSAVTMSAQTVCARELPTCDGGLIDGSICGRGIVRDHKCLAHLFLRGDVRLREPARRITSRAKVMEEVEEALPKRIDKRGMAVNLPVGKLSAAQVTHAMHSGFARLAAEFGWEQVDDDAFIHVGRAA